MRFLGAEDDLKRQYLLELLKIIIYIYPARTPYIVDGVHQRIGIVYVLYLYSIEMLHDNSLNAREL